MDFKVVYTYATLRTQQHDCAGRTRPITAHRSQHHSSLDLLWAARASARIEGRRYLLGAPHVKQKSVAMTTPNETHIAAWLVIRIIIRIIDCASSAAQRLRMNAVNGLCQNKCKPAKYVGVATRSIDKIRQEASEDVGDATNRTMRGPGTTLP
jgi:hypothetical protein